MPVNTSTVTIGAGESISDALDVSGALWLAIITPPIWTPANVTFQYSPDGTNFYDLFAIGNHEVTLSMQDRLSTLTPLDDLDIPKNGHIRLRSGSRNYPVLQEAVRTFRVVVET